MSTIPSVKPRKLARLLGRQSIIAIVSGSCFDPYHNLLPIELQSRSMQGTCGPPLASSRALR
jgi:hypothetical protein